MNTSDRPEQAKPARTGWRLSLAAKTLVVFVAVAMLPVAFVAVWLTGLYRGAIETTERQLQTAVLAELSGLALRSVEDAQGDAEAIASALSFAASQAQATQDVTSAVRGLLATRRSIRALRFEVPEAHVNAVIRHSDVATEDIPTSTPEMRQHADHRGASLVVSNPAAAVLVVPIPKTSQDAPSGYVTARVELGPIAESLRTVAETRFDGHNVHLLMIDAEHRVVASFGAKSLSAGSSANGLPILSVLPTGTPWTRQVSVISEHRADSLAVVGGIQTVPKLGWAVAVWRPKAEAYASLSALLPRFAIAALASLLLAALAGVLAARSISAPVVRLSAEARRIGERKFHELGPEESRLDELGDLSRSMHQMARTLEASETEIRREAQLRSNLSRFLSRELVEAIVRGEHDLALGGSRAEISVLFADVVAFTPLAENRAPEEMVALLNELFSMLSEIVFRHQGTVDKFIGDCIMAVWGAPDPEPNHAKRSLMAAEEMMRFLEVGNEEWRERYGVELRLAIGINSGSVIVGNIGSKKRMEYTAIGDVVNVAARLESLARPNQILLAEPTRKLVQDEFVFRSHGEHQLSGKSHKTLVYELCTD